MRLDRVLPRLALVALLGLWAPLAARATKELPPEELMVHNNEPDGPYPGLAMLSGTYRDRTGCNLARVRLERVLARYQERHKQLPWGAGEHRITGEDQEKLRQQGFLAVPFRDSVFQPAAHDHFVISKDGVLACLAHGTLYGQPNARADLVKSGFTDPEILKAAWESDPPAVPGPFSPRSLAKYAAAAALVWWLRRRTLALTRPRSILFAILEALCWTAILLAAMVAAWHLPV
jgi:hypothetical protein